MFILFDVIIKIASRLHTHTREQMEGWYEAHSVCCCVLKTLSRCLRKCKHVILTTRAFSSVCMLSTRIISLPFSLLLVHTHIVVSSSRFAEISHLECDFQCKPFEDLSKKLSLERRMKKCAYLKSYHICKSQLMRVLLQNFFSTLIAE